MSAGFMHIVCECTYAFICPWDRYCAGCGRSLTGDEARALVTLPMGVKVGNDAQVGFTVDNASEVSIHVAIPHIETTGKPPPAWLVYDKGTGNRQEFDLAPGESRRIVYDINRKVVEEQLRRDTAGFDVSFALPVYLDSDYRHQQRRVTFSLLAQADLRPIAAEFKYLWLTNPSTLRLPFQIRTSGEEMEVIDVQTHCDRADHRDIVEALFPSQGLARFRGMALAGGNLIDIAVESRPVGEALEGLSRDKAPRVADPYASKRRHRWLEKWPEVTVVSFDVEVRLRSTGVDAVPPVRSLVVIELVRPPILRDATPDDDLWKFSDGRTVERQGALVDDSGFGVFEADLTNASAIPLRVDDIVPSKRWASIIDTVLPTTVPPGGGLLVKVRVDMSKREEDELQRPVLDTDVRLVTSPPTPMPHLEKLTVRAQSTVILPGALGIDFGTSNCAVCFMPAGELPEVYTQLNPDPVLLPLDEREQVADTNLASVVVRRLKPSVSDREPDFAFGAEAENLEGVAPENVVRGIKRLLASTPPPVLRLRNEDPGRDAIEPFTAAEIAARMLKHILRQTERMAPRSEPLLRRLSDAAQRNPQLGYPDPQALSSARAYRFRKAVFTHPVDATEGMKRLLYTCAKDAGLAIGADGTELSFEAFSEECLIDEASAAIGQFVFSQRSALVAMRKHDQPSLRLLCVDVGGGTTDISVMKLDTSRRNWVLQLLYREGMNDFAGMDLDREIVVQLILKRANEKLVGANKPPVASKLIESVLRGVDGDKLASDIRYNLGKSADEELVKRTAESAIDVALELRKGAEAAKKRAGREPQGTEKVLLLGKTPTYDEVTYATLSAADVGTLPVDVSSASVNELVGRMMTQRIGALDNAVRKAQWTWTDVDILMFTGQTCRAPALREAVLRHVRAARGGSLPRLVAPPGAEGDAPDVIVFDPKMCVPAGAALLGVGRNRIQLTVPKSLPADLVTDDWTLRNGAPVPAFERLYAVLDDDDQPFVWVDIAGATHDTPVLDGRGFGASYTLVVDTALCVWVVATGPEGADPAADVPKELATALNGLARSMWQQYNILGPVVTWFARMAALSGGTA